MSFLAKFGWNTSILNNDYTKWSVIVLTGSFLTSFLNYTFILIMGKLLEPPFFGEIYTIFGLMVIIVAPTQALSNYISRHTSFLAGQGNHFEARAWLRRMSYFIFFFSLVLFLVFLFLIPPLSRFLGINSLPLLIFSFSIPFAFILAVQTGILQGLKSFTNFSFQNILGAILKLSLATIFVYMGLFVPGVMLALIISLGAVCFYNYVKIKLFWKNLNLKEEIRQSLSDIDFKSSFSKSFLVVFISALFIAVVSNIDVVLAKHFFDPKLAGEYAALSTIGKILLYATSAFVTVMFAVVSESFVEKKTYAKKIFRNSLFYIIAISLPMIAVMSLLPKTFVGVFFGLSYFTIAPFLPIFSIAMFVLSLSIAFIHYFLATRNNSFLFLFAIGVLLQIILIGFYHDNVLNIVMSVLWSSVFLLSAFIANYLIIEKRNIFSEYYVLFE